LMAFGSVEQHAENRGYVPVIGAAASADDV
jgi:hypothetical protein